MRRSTRALSNARSRSGNSANSSLKRGLKLRNELADFGRNVVALQRHRQIGDHEPGFVATVVSLGIDFEGMKRLLADQLGHGIGQLDLAARADLAGIEHAQYLGL